MNKKALFTLLIPAMAFAAAPSPLEVRSEAFEAQGTAQEILSRAKTCVAKFVRYESIRIDTGSTFETTLSAVPQEKRNNTIPGGEVIVDYNPDTGALVANNRLSAKFVLGSSFYIDSLLSIDAREGKFRITHTDIKTDAREPLGKMRGLTKPATEALINQSRALAECIKTPPTDDF